MKQYKAALALVLCAVMAGSFVACKNGEEGEDTTAVQTTIVAVTDKKGDPVVDENGEQITEVVVITEKATDKNDNDTDSTDGGETDKKDKDKKNKSKDKSKDNQSESDKAEDSTTKSNEPITKMPDPKAPKGVKAVKTEVDYIEFRWDKGECTGYDLQFKKSEYGDEHWVPLKQDFHKTKYVLQSVEDQFDITSNTSYDFRIRAVNHNTAGKSVSKWVTVTAKTKLNTEPRKLKCLVTLPIAGELGYKQDVLIITYYGYNKKDKKYNIELESHSYDVPFDNQTVETPETDKKYEGKIKVVAELEREKKKAVAVTDNEICELDLSDMGVPIQDGGED